MLKQKALMFMVKGPTMGIAHAKLAKIMFIPLLA